MMNYDLVHEIKKAIINPLESFNILLELDLPKNKYPYISELYQTLYPILTGVYKIELLQMDLDRVLDEREINDEILEEMASASLINRKVKLYNDIMVVLKDDVIKFETKYANKLGEKSSAQHAASMVVKVLSRIDIDPDKIIDDLTVAGVSEHHADTYAAIICKITNHMLRQLIKMADDGKEGKIVMDSSIKNENQAQLNEEVNKLDKGHGLNLKKPKNPVDYEKIYEVALNSYTTYLSMCILNLNDLHIDRFFEFKKDRVKQIKNIRAGSKPFRKFSPLFNTNEDDVFATDMLIYRGRFLTFLLQDLVKYLEEMICVYSEHVGSEFSKWEDSYKVLLLFNDNIKEFVVSWCKGYDYGKSLMFIYQAFALMKTEKPVKTAKDMEVIRDQIEAFGIGQKPMTKFTLNTSKSLDTVLKLAYVVITEQTKIKDCIKMTEDIKYRDKTIIKDRISELGKSIVNYQDKTDSSDIELYTIFENASPNLKFKFSDVGEYENLEVGCRALAFLALLTNDKHIWKMVRKISVA